MPLTPDKKITINGLVINQYFLTESKNNPNKIDMPAGNRKKTVAITVHNTEAINTAPNTTAAEQYTRATKNGAMKSVRVHYYVDDYCAWQNMPDDWVNWSCADGTANANSGNNTSVAIEVIGNSGKAEANAIKLVAYLLKKYNLTVDSGLRTHTYWLNVRDGKTGSIDYLNTAHNSYKNCPIYILPHWSTFKENVRAEFNKINGVIAEPEKPAQTTPATLYRIRKTWNDVKSQIGAFSTLENAKKAWKEGYIIFDSNGKQVYPNETELPTSAAGPKNSTTDKINVKYRVYAKKKWWPEVSNTTDYAGVKGYQITAVAAQVDKGTISYRVHQKGSNWMSWIGGYNINDIIKGYAGIPGIAIDAIQIKFSGVDGFEAKYRVAAPGKDYYDWVYNDSDYAGVFGQVFDRLQIEIVKK